MTKLRIVSLLAILAILGYVEGAFASGKTTPLNTNEDSHAKKAGRQLGKAAKNLEHAYKEAVVKPSKELKKGMKEGKESEKGQTE